MKKVITYCVILFCVAITTTTAQVQCPISISDKTGDGDEYDIILSNSSQCSYYTIPGTVTLNGVTFNIGSCNTAVIGMTTTTTLNVGAANPMNLVPLLSSAPITFVGGGISGCIYGSTGFPTPLPIELIEFKGTPSVSGNVLTWATASEVNNKGFQIERLNASSSWDNIGFKTANNKASTYQFTDNSPFTTSYYRLRQIDNDGKETLSKIVSVAQTDKGKGLKVYPNPVSSLLTIENTEGADFQILNLLGQPVLTGKTASEGMGLDVSALPQGTYFLKVGAEQAKFLKQ